MDDIIVSDDEYESLKAALGAYGDAFEEQLGEYLGILTVICDSIVTEGLTAQSLQAFSLQARAFMGKTKELTGFMQASCSSFVSDIDAADEYIY